MADDVPAPLLPLLHTTPYTVYLNSVQPGRPLRLTAAPTLAGSPALVLPAPPPPGTHWADNTNACAETHFLFVTTHNKCLCRKVPF